MVNVKNPEDVMSWDASTLWNAFSQIISEDKSYAEETEKIKNGIKIKFPIWYITEEWYEIYPSSKRAKVMGFGKYKIDDFMNEVEERQTLMRKIILENIEELGVTSPRIGSEED